MLLVRRMRASSALSVMWPAACVLLIALQMCAATETFELLDGRRMPAIALGTYLGFDQNGVVKPENKQVRDVVMSAIDAGYRHVDTAAIYRTEAEVGEAVTRKIQDGTVKRDDMFITTKLWNTKHKREQVAGALRESLDQLGLNYVDLYLMHWPISMNEDNSLSDVDYMETWRGMEDVHKLGLAKSIGVSNFNREQLERLLQEGSVKPVALQIEVHPQLVQQELVEYAQANNIVVMGYSPFGSLVKRYGLDFPGPKVTSPDLVAIANKYNKTVPQVVLRWNIDRHIVPIPKTVNQKRLTENIDVFDFKLDEEMRTISAYNTNTRYTLPSFWQEHPHYPFEKVASPLPNVFKTS